MRKKNSSNYRKTLPIAMDNLKPGEVLTDLAGKKWKIGKPIGNGGFGQIYLASDVLNQEVGDGCPFVAKVECHSNGPLFVEINCYLRTGLLQMIEEWKQQHQLSSLGMPHYVASGSHVDNGCKYRFLILPRYEKDLESVFQSKKKFNLKTVLTVSMQIIDILQYIHGKGYVHSDIKASNILLGQATVPEKPVFCYRGCNPVRKCRMPKLRKSRRSNNLVSYIDDIPDFETLVDLYDDPVVEVKKKQIDQVYLLDYGLASKYVTSSNAHKVFCKDERRAHAGTILFCSRDAHKGAQSRRSDLECLGFNMVYWLSGYLPWMNDIEDPEAVAKKKQRCMDNLSEFLKLCFGDCPKFLLDYFEYLLHLDFVEKPDYAFCERLFRNALKEYGYRNDGRFDFDNCEGWGNKRKRVRNSENRKRRPPVYTVSRFPLQSNFSVKPSKLLRKKMNKKALAYLNWSKILIDPEIIIKKQKKMRERKLTESSDPNPAVSVLDMDIYKLNPTYAMVEVFNKSKERLNCNFGNNSPAYKFEGETINIEGYTPAMMTVYNRMKEREILENEATNSEDEYYYKFPTKKRSTIGGAKKKHGRKRKAVAGEKKVVPAKRPYRLRG